MYSHFAMRPHAEKQLVIVVVFQLVFISFILQIQVRKGGSRTLLRGEGCLKTSRGRQGEVL